VSRYLTGVGALECHLFDTVRNLTQGSIFLFSLLRHFIDQRSTLMRQDQTTLTSVQKKWVFSLLRGFLNISQTCLLELKMCQTLLINQGSNALNLMFYNFFKTKWISQFWYFINRHVCSDAGILCLLNEQCRRVCVRCPCHSLCLILDTTS